MHDDDDVLADRDTCEGWVAYLAQFKRDVYPIFVRYGISFENALLIWEMNRVRNTVREAGGFLHEDDDSPEGDD